MKHKVEIKYNYSDEYIVETESDEINIKEIEKEIKAELEECGYNAEDCADTLILDIFSKHKKDREKVKLNFDDWGKNVMVNINTYKGDEEDE